MTIAACLCWYDEPVRFLERCVASLAGVADVLVHADGAWQHFPEGKTLSPPDQRDALYLAAVDAGIPVWEVKSEDGEIWSSQVEKRDALYSSAVELVQPDWFLIVDGDEHVVFAADDLRERLESLGQDHASVRLVETNGRLSMQSSASRRIFRGVLGIGVRETHNGVYLQGRWLNGPRRVRRESPANLTDALTIEHEARARGPARNKKQQLYYDERSRLRVEVAG